MKTKMETMETKEIEKKVYEKMKNDHGTLYARLYMVWAKMDQKCDTDKKYQGVQSVLDNTLNLWDHHLSA